MPLRRYGPCGLLFSCALGCGAGPVASPDEDPLGPGIETAAPGASSGADEDPGATDDGDGASPKFDIGQPPGGDAPPTETGCQKVDVVDVACSEFAPEG